MLFIELTMKISLPHITSRGALCLLALGAFMLPAVPTQAKRASKAVYSVTQPDGTTLRLQKHGDEYGHYLTTDDGIPVIKNGETYYYALGVENGYPIASDIVARPAASRPAEHSAMLQEMNVAKIRASLSQVKSALHKPQEARMPKSAVTRGPGLCSTTFPAYGEQKGLVILVEFKDKKFATPNVKEYFTNLLNKEGFSENDGTGSARDWFIENSKGKFIPQFDVYGPVTLPQKMSYYGGNDYWGNDKNPEQMVVQACQLLNDEIDFSEYDRDNNKQVDNVYIFYAGYGEADYNDENTVWPHSWDLSDAGVSSPLLDGCYLEHYACSNELDGVLSKPDGIGTFVHEFSHVLGLPDLYCTEYYENSSREPFTPGEYSVLDYGPYNNNGHTPPNYSAYERYALDWMTPEELTETKNCSLEEISSSNKAYIINTDSPNEYFLFENRQQTGNDTYIPGHGMVIWHIDYNKSVFDNNTVNNTKNHQYVDMVEADGTQLERDRNCDVFPGPLYIDEFSGNSTPRMVSWSAKVPDVGIHHIFEDENGLISFRAVKNGDDPDKDPDEDNGDDNNGDEKNGDDNNGDDNNGDDNNGDDNNGDDNNGDDNNGDDNNGDDNNGDDNNGDDNTESVNGVETNNFAPYTVGLHLFLGENNLHADIFDITGAKIFSTKKNDVILPAAGMYIVKIGTKTYKVIAR